MDAFRWISVTLSLVLGLGITRLLSSAVAVFRSREYAKMDWIPLVWATCIFIWQLQFWWAIIELPVLIKTWSIIQFLFLLALPLLLFVAAALILPHTEMEKGESLAELFVRDGRWALLFISAYFSFAIAANWYFWGISPFTYEGGLDAAQAIVPLVFLRVTSRRGQEVITILYLALSIWGAWVESPKSY
ncbi:MAG: hypothetical protein HGB11_11940 [Chlorobiales bacterium]|nr:hypothetical protein [Chlorobiales bacterium]